MIFFLQVLGFWLVGLGLRKFIPWVSLQLQAGNFSANAIHLIRASLLSLGFDRFWRIIDPLTQQSLRERLFALALSPLSGVLYGLFVLAAVIFAAWLGLSTWPLDFSQSPLIFLISDSGVFPFLTCLIIGLVPALLVGKPYLSFVLLALLLPAFLISLPGAIFMVAGEQIGLVLHALIRKRTWRTELSLQLICLLLSALIFFSFGSVLRELFISDPSPYIRVVNFLILLAAWIALELIMSLGFLHFAYAWHCNQALVALEKNRQKPS